MASNSTRALAGARALAAAAATLALTGLAAGPARAAASVPVAGGITDPRGDFLDSFIGSHDSADLDVRSANVTYDGRNIYFTATMWGDIGATENGLYVWGIDRGGATDILFHPPAGQPPVGENVNFNTFITLFANRTGEVHFTTGEQTVAIGANEISIDGATINLKLSRDLFAPTNGSDISQFGFNMWPRIIGVGSTTFVADFAPDDRNFLGTAVPEPSSWALMIGGFGLAGGALRRRRTRTVPA